MTAQYAPQTPAEPEVQSFTVQVEGGSGSGQYQPGEMVTVTAEEREGYTFSNWMVQDNAVWLDDSTQPQVTFPMPEWDVYLTANYTEKIPEEEPQPQPEQPPR